MKMKVLDVVGVVAIAIWLMLTVPANSANIVFDVESATTGTYSTFLTSFREAVKDKKLTCHGIIMATSPTELPKYVLVDLKIGTGKNVQTFTLAFKRGDLYLEGYTYIYNNECRYRIFKDSESDAKATLCPKATGDPATKNKIPYAKSYQGMESKAGPRSKIGLGKIILKSKMEKIYGKDPTGKQFEKLEAEFLLIAVQMIAEASRFKYIEDKVNDDFGDANGYMPDPKAISLELNWESVSKTIANVNTPDDNTIVTLPSDLKDENDDPWTEATMKQLKEDIMALLKRVDKCKIKRHSMFPEIMSHYYWTSVINLGKFEEI